MQYKLTDWLPTTKKEMELRHEGAYYHISPWGLSWDDENYYLVGYDSEAGKIKHYRVDKMLRIRMTEEEREKFLNKFDDERIDLLKEITGIESGEFKGAYNIRKDGQGLERKITDE